MPRAWGKDVQKGCVKQSRKRLPVSYTHLDVYKRQENCQLLQHIADRIAIAVGNADAWRSMTDLQESLQQENHQLSEQLLSNLGVGDIIYQSQDVYKRQPGR